MFRNQILIDGPDDIDLGWLTGVATVGLTAGASAPEHLVQAVVRLLSAHGWEPQEVVAMEEDVRFQLPRELHGENESC